MSLSDGEKEQVKLTAAYLNGIAIALFAVGGLAQVLSALKASLPNDQAANLYASLWFAVGCFVASIALHITARVVLLELDE